METSEDSPETRATLRLVKGLVIALTAAMVAGVIALVALLVIRLPDGSVPLPAQIVLPDGAAPTAFTRGPDWIAVATADAILLYDLAGTLRRTIPVAFE